MAVRYIRLRKMSKVINEEIKNAASLLGKLGGSVKSAAKKHASIENGKLGGRPPKDKAGKKKRAASPQILKEKT